MKVKKWVLGCLLLAGTAGAALGVTAAVGPDSGDGGERGRPLTTAEAQRFALARFSRYEASPVGLELRVPRGEATLLVSGVVDYRSHRAVGRYGVADTKGGDSASAGSRGLVAWDEGGLGVRPGASSPRDVTRAAAKPARTAWSPRSYTSDPFDRALRLSQSLGTDRPENAQLLAQGGARWLRSERVGGRTYDVFAGPRPRTDRTDRTDRRTSVSPLTYWVSRDGQLRRLEARMDGLPRPVRIDFTGAGNGHGARAGNGAGAGAASKLPDRPWGGPARRS
ncbi:hypothetical protein [Streptomyces sp. NPDC048172]|uniref:hypothetical protein n=1 Tax=Streptomyces sp. NPDC048172 TaxID=3365505 RepID=UPI003710EFA1